jgi:hypothetical protein
VRYFYDTEFLEDGKTIELWADYSAGAGRGPAQRTRRRALERQAVRRLHAA